MSRDLNQVPGVARSEGAAEDPSRPRLGEAQPVGSSVRAEYVEQRRRLVSELTKCHEDTEVLGPLIQELRSISRLQESFSFSDAVAFSSQGQGVDGEQAVYALKSRISLAVQQNVAQATTLCRTPEERTAFMSRLERQFQEMQQTLVNQERQRCAEKLNTLCDRLDLIVESLAQFPVRTRQHEALLAVMAQALRAYSNESLGQPSIEVGQPEPSERHDLSKAAAMNVSQFLKLLDDVTVETLCEFIDHAAA
jgi:hypothetical protein